MATQRAPMSPLQYWVYRFKRLPTRVHIILHILFALIILFSSIKPSTLVKERYPGDVKIVPTIRVITVPTTIPHPTVAAATPLPPPPSAPIEQSAPVVEQAPVVEPQQPVATVVVSTEAPTPNKEATVQAWLAAPPSTATPAPGDPGFVESFQPQPECSIFVGYIGAKRQRCNQVYATQTAESQ